MVKTLVFFRKSSPLTPEWKNCLCPKSNLDWIFFMVPDVLVYKSNVNCFKQNFSEWKPNARCLAAMSQSWSLYKIIHFGYSIKKSMRGSDRISINGPPANKLFLCFCIINVNYNISLPSPPSTFKWNSTYHVQ